MNNLPALLLTFCGLFFISDSFGQIASADSSALPSQVQAAIKQYHQVMGGQGHIYAGGEYVEGQFRSKGHPYLLSKEWEEASIRYDGLLYEKVPLLYDLVMDGLLISHFDEDGIFMKVKIDQEKVSAFTLAGRNFVRLRPDSVLGSPLSPGLYQLLYDGDVQVLAKRQKRKREAIVDQVVEISFEDKDRYFIRKGNKYYPVKNKASVLRVFGDHKKELARKLRQSGILFGQDPEAALLLLAQSYDALKEKP